MRALTNILESCRKPNLLMRVTAAWTCSGALVITRGKNEQEKLQACMPCCWRRARLGLTTFSKSHARMLHLSLRTASNLSKEPMTGSQKPRLGPRVVRGVAAVEPLPMGCHACGP
ncbi:hypothetical protein PVAP13_4NG079000 [Panicum virgatum]|uniref:Uncharacterized protein n=1 Tax=Panicum virgatum TaxID=38727 RepID=A0A8T0T2H2_PANVG|nr:hypothetical protein PVAP13_4NG079000 [Panicum virgatum]